MKKILSEKFAANGIIVFLVIIILFHLYVLTGNLNYDMVWGGKIENRSQMFLLEFVSIFTNIIMIIVTAVRVKYINWNYNMKYIRVILWVMFVLFLLNSFGNYFSDSEQEKIIFTPITILLALFSLRLALK